MENSAYVRCHLCELDIPKVHLKEHMETIIHMSNVKITNIALEKSRKCINAKFPTLEQSNPDNKPYCATCNCEYVDKNIHFSSYKHSKLSMFEEILSKICDIFKNSENSLHILDDMKNILNKQNIDSEIKGTKTVADIIIPGTTYCDICKVYKATVGFSGHVKSKTHKNNLKDLSPNKDLKTESLATNVPQETTYCEICKVYKNTKAFKCHLVCKSHINKCIENNIPVPKLEGLKYCNVCQLYLNTPKYTEHVNSEKHKLKMATCSKVKEETTYDNSEMFEGHDKKYIVNGKGVNKYCKLCDTDIMNNTNNINQHIKSKIHMNKYTRMLEDNKITKLLKEYFCSECDVFFDDLVEHLKNNRIRESLKNYCNICKVTVPIGGLAIHEKGQNHLKAMESQKKKSDINYIRVDLKRVQDFKGMITVKYKMLNCKICDVPLSAGDIVEHFENSMHVVNFILFARKNGLEPANDKEYFCSLCNVNVDRNLAYNHIEINHDID